MTYKPKKQSTVETNPWLHITYKGGESGIFKVTTPGGYRAEFDSLSAAQRARDEALNGPPEPGPAPISPQAFGYFDHERQT